DYASDLLEIAQSFRRVPRVAAIAMARSAQLQDRIVAIVDHSRARRAPRAFLLSVLWAAMLSLVATIAAQKLESNDSEVGALREKQIGRLENFAKAKEKQSLALLTKAGQKISHE